MEAGEVSALTRLLCDIERVRQGRFTLDELRARWADGKYPGLRPDWAADYIRLGGL